LDNPDKTPTFGFAARPALSNFNDVTNTALIVLVVNTNFRPALDVFAVLWMFDLEVDRNFDAFVATVAHYHAG